MSTDHDKTPEDKTPEDRLAERDDWQPCPAGSLERLKRRQTRRFDQRPYALGICSGLILAFAAALLWSNPASALPARLTCQHVKPLLDDYAAGQLDARTHEKVSNHLAICDHCYAVYQQQIAADGYRGILSEPLIAMR